MTSLPIPAGPVQLREWRESDRDDLVAEANSRAVWRNMMEVFPHPYMRSDAVEWINRCMSQDVPRDVVVARGDRLIGVCGYQPSEGVGRYTASVGYWLGERHLDQGIMTAALGAFLDYVWATFDVRRLEAAVFAWNPASARVLEKNGFQLEGVQRQAIYKDGEFVDQLFYSLLRSDVR